MPRRHPPRGAPPAPLAFRRRLVERVENDLPSLLRRERKPQEKERSPLCPKSTARSA
jgi:hypothetical protein